MTTYPMRYHFPNQMMEQAMTQRKLGLDCKPGKARAGLTITYPNAAGIDIGSAAHFVAVPPDRDDEPVREFPSFTELLESRGFTVLLVNARHVKNVAGRKADVLDCQWLQQLLTYGLLRGAFRPADQVCVLRALWRQRSMLLRSQSRHVQHMQKALTQMNVQLANVISDVAGETGQKILRALRRWRARWSGPGQAEERAHPRQQRRDCQEPARQLAHRTPVRAEASAGCLRLRGHPAG